MSLINLYSDPREDAKKLKLQQKVIDISKQLNDPQTEARYLSYTAMTYYFWGQHDRAWAIYRQAHKDVFDPTILKVRQHC